MTRLNDAGGDRMNEAIESIGRDTGDTLETVQRISAQTIVIQQTITSGHHDPITNRDEEAALNAIQPRADSARYDSGSQSSSSFCLEDTRVKLLDEIEKWAEDPNSRPIFWLCGMAGTGKSTIARTVAKRFNDRHCLGASFFFSRDEDDRRTANLVFPTIAYQLARRIPSLREHIVKAATPDVCTAMMRTQLNELIVEPFQNSTFQCSTLVIVIDALDECVKESQITEMLVLLAPAIKTIQKTTTIKLFLTSRPEVHISSEFGEPGMEAVASVSILHDIEKSLVRSDIGRYVDHHLQRIAKVILPRHVVWPTLEEKEALVNIADGLFIFAAVTIAYIGDAKHREPKQRLRNILSASAQNQVSVSLVHLDILYRQILMASLPDDDKGEDNQHLKLRICEILGTLVLLLYPLSSRWLEKLLKWEEDTVEPTLGAFHSVLSIPPNPTPIRVFHKSFPDFLTNKQRSGEFWFHIDPKEHHTRLALLCLKHMSTSLRRDMCDVGNGLVSELDVETILQTKVEGHVLYACRYWAAHLKEAVWTDELGAALKYFCEHRILYWLEILCLDRKLGSAILALDYARQWTLDDSSSTTLANGYRYLLYYRSTILLGPSHIYQSTLPFIPRQNLSSSPWEKELHRSPRVIMTDSHDTWDRILFTLTARSGGMNAVAYSPDGGLLATGSDDGGVIIWDSRTGAQIHSLEGHSDAVLAVDFSPTGCLIASGSWDNSVRIWSSVTGVLIHTLNGHTGAVTAVSFSPLGNIVASGSRDKTVNLWDPGNGSLLRILGGASSDLCSIRFSPDGTQIVAPSSHSGIIIWDTETGAVQSRLQYPSIIYCIAFSPDGTLLAFVSEREVIIWDYKSRTISRKLEVEVCSVTFSRDGRFIATGMDNGQIVTWDITNDSEIGIFNGHTDRVESLAVSPDGSCIISGSKDGTAAVWDMKSGWESPGESDDKVHYGAVNCVAFSSDGKKMASGGDEGTVAVWDTEAHGLIHTLKDHEQPVMTVAFSVDGRYIASGTYLGRMVVWDVEVGEPVRILEVGNSVERLRFSADGLFLVAKYTSQGSTTYAQWSAQNFQECEQRSITKEQAKQMLRGTPAYGVPPSETYLVGGRGSQWIEIRCNGFTVERLCHLPQHDITVSASFGRYFVFGATHGVYCLEFPPGSFDISSTSMYMNDPMFD
ncbi:hypothetical protein FRC03_000689 [Tulasnella sp. 419]|nr:hypothetical protein FRC03_000689 [Tulasnella sp. 419]